MSTKSSEKGSFGDVEGRESRRTTREGFRGIIEDIVVSNET